MGKVINYSRKSNAKEELTRLLKDNKRMLTRLEEVSDDDANMLLGRARKRIIKMVKEIETNEELMSKYIGDVVKKSQSLIPVAALLSYISPIIDQISSNNGSCDINNLYKTIVASEL